MSFLQLAVFTTTSKSKKCEPSVRNLKPKSSKQVSHVKSHLILTTRPHGCWIFHSSQWRQNLSHFMKMHFIWSEVAFKWKAVRSAVNTLQFSTHTAGFCYLLFLPFVSFKSHLHINRRSEWEGGNLRHIHTINIKVLVTGESQLAVVAALQKVRAPPSVSLKWCSSDFFTLSDIIQCESSSPFCLFYGSFRLD